MTVSNMIGPVEQMSLNNHPIKGLYFLAPGLPEVLQLYNNFTALVFFFSFFLKEKKRKNYTLFSNWSLAANQSKTLDWPFFKLFSNGLGLYHSLHNNNNNKNKRKKLLAT